MTEGREGVDEAEDPIEGTAPDAGSNPARSTTQHELREMDREDWDTLGLWIREAANTLGLRDWYLVVNHSPPNKEQALASVETVKGRRFATIRVCSDFRQLTDWEQRNALVHELLHCHFDGVQHLLFETIPGQVGGAAAQAIMEGTQMSLEFGVDGLATALCDGFPPIPWTTERPEEPTMGMPVD